MFQNARFLESLQLYSEISCKEPEKSHFFVFQIGKRQKPFLDSNLLNGSQLIQTSKISPFKKALRKALKVL